MDVSKKTLIYGFLKNHIGQESRYIPENLCPYMRRFMVVFCIEFAIGFFLLLFINGMLFLPVALAMGMSIEEGTYLNDLLNIGLAGWILVSILGVVGGGIFLFDKDFAARKAMNNAINRVAKTAGGNIFIQWYKAVHDRVCPVLKFTN